MQITPSPENPVAARRIRVVFSIDNMNLGGTELNAVRIAELLDPVQFDLRVICLQDSTGPLRARYEAAGVPVHVFPIRKLYGWVAVQQGYRLMRYLRREAIDVVHAHDIYSNVFVVPWARMAGVRVIASRRWWEGFSGLHWQISSRLAYRFADVALANSELIAGLLRDREAVPDTRVSVVPNFVDEVAFVPPTERERDELLARLKLTEEDRILGIVANLLPIKDHVSLLRAVARLSPRFPQLRLVVVGDGENRTMLEYLARHLGIAEKVRFAGRIMGGPNIHYIFEVSVLCSLSEGLSNSILEAMAAGRPVVATDVGASRDAVLDGRTGILVPPRDPERLAAALDGLLSDPRRASSLGERGQRRAAERYSPQAAIEALEGLYQRLVRSAAHTRRAVSADVTGLR